MTLLPVSYGSLEIPMSSKGRDIKEIIRQPTYVRQPVHYNKKFLDDYQPNVTYYLSPDLRAKLYEIGKIDHRYADMDGKKILQRLTLDLCWNSSRLEGNTYSLLETDRLLSSGEMAEGKKPFEAKMILNHKRAIEYLVNTVKETGFSRDNIFNLHKLLSADLVGDPSHEGRLRVDPVIIGGSVYCPPYTPELIEECFQQIVKTAAEIQDPYEQSFFSMVHFPYLQPFIDINKRTSRLAANISLIRDNLCPLSFVDLPARAYVDGILGVYELNRVELLSDIFFWAYDRSSLRYGKRRGAEFAVRETDVYYSEHHEKKEQIIAWIVREKFNKKQAIDFIQQEAHRVPPSERLRFIETVETELLCLHETDIPAYRLTPSQYHTWLEVWR